MISEALLSGRDKLPPGAWNAILARDLRSNQSVSDTQQLLDLLDQAGYTFYQWNLGNPQFTVIESLSRIARKAGYRIYARAVPDLAQILKAEHYIPVVGIPNQIQSGPRAGKTQYVYVTSTVFETDTLQAMQKLPPIDTLVKTSNQKLSSQLKSAAEDELPDLLAQITENFVFDDVASLEPALIGIRHFLREVGISARSDQIRNYLQLLEEGGVRLIQRGRRSSLLRRDIVLAKETLLVV